MVLHVPVCVRVRRACAIVRAYVCVHVCVCVFFDKYENRREMFAAKDAACYLIVIQVMICERVKGS